MDINEQENIEYKDFNGYKAASDADNNIPQPSQPLFYDQPQDQPAAENNTSVNGIISIVLGLFGCCCYGLPSIVGLIMGIIGVKRKKDDILSIIGIVICAMVIVYFVYCIFYISTHPDEFRQMYEMMMEQMYGTVSNSSI
ncbi:MAG: DUF4190 domain-containing protein [Clostridia bacterium]|nr:DUF4190 domain-containing protein [Clostridia bacterium]